ncbi:MAG: chorismate synthase, partial [Gemmatimonadetes bacterium]|nr:chorismate synthase [Gemmatimonadota bacterium]
RITTFGESHGVALGVVIDGVRPGIKVELDQIQEALDRRRPGTSRLTSPRKEGDRLEVLSGLFEGKTTGAPIAFLVRNKDARPGHYEEIKDVFRPGHADFTWWRKFGIRDWRGGGRTSGRETVARVAAGALAQQILARVGVRITGHVISVGEVDATRFVPEFIDQNDVRCADPDRAQAMWDTIEAARKDGDSVGGVVEVRVEGAPAGWGDPVFMKVDAMLASALMSIGAVKGVEIGDGFGLTRSRGSQTNDAMSTDGFLSNHMGGVLGGITNGQEIVVRAAVKPTSSIRHEQSTIDQDGNPRTIVVRGRHDPCICIRVVPVAEAMVALVLCDAYLRQLAITEGPGEPSHRAAELAHCDFQILRWIDRRRGLATAAVPGEIARELDEEVRASRQRLGTEAGFPDAYLAELFRVVDEAPDPDPGGGTPASGVAPMEEGSAMGGDPRGGE